MLRCCPAALPDNDISRTHAACPTMSLSNQRPRDDPCQGWSLDPFGLQLQQLISFRLGGTGLEIVLSPSALPEGTGTLTAPTRARRASRKSVTSVTCSSGVWLFHACKVTTESVVGRIGKMVQDSGRKYYCNEGSSST